ncbi:TetR/AcrR family transcriptional regulator [Gordonia sp. DT30]|uniref:TetR/AcrR family transcriptional regulator n=1 Tax=unclassified Gordonia (in: high G+C Gram-positive bacteria) TaxID=2657482 RepID=UPI003CF61F84
MSRMGADNDEQRGADTSRRSARGKLLAAADELFYQEGVNTVGIDRVIEQAGVAKASLYRLFGSKEHLAAAYLRARHEIIAAQLVEAVLQAPDARSRILAVFATQARRLRSPDYRGCAFARASAEPAAGPEVMKAAEDYRDFTLKLLTDLAVQGGAPDPKTTGMQLQALYHASALLGTRHRRQLIASTRAAVETLLDSAFGSPH